MLPYVLIIAAVLIIAVALRLFAGPDQPDNGITHIQQDGKRDGGSEPDGEPPDSGGEDGRDDVALTTFVAA